MEFQTIDIDDDIRIGVKSTAILFGDADRLVIGALQVGVFIVLLIIGNRLEMSYYYYLGLTVAAGLALYQQYLIKDRDPDRCFAAFLNNNWFGMAVFAGILLHYLATAAGSG